MYEHECERNRNVVRRYMHGRDTEKVQLERALELALQPPSSFSRRKSVVLVNIE